MNMQDVEDIALSKGTVIKNRYLIEQIYYLGHTCIVYICKDIDCLKKVVLKEYCPYHLANRDMDGKSVICKSNGLREQYEQAYQLFEQECEIVNIVSDVKTPYEKCTVQYLDSFEENNTKYLVTEYIEGISLEDHMKETKSDWKDYMLSLIKIVERLHKMGIIHRDIKPSNIMLDQAGRPILIDFGSACFVDEKKNRAKLPFVSRGYSAPELYNGTPVGKQADIYSIGALIYYAITGFQLPAPNEMEEDDEIPKISEFVQIKEPLEQAIFETLEQNPQNRAQELTELLEAI